MLQQVIIVLLMLMGMVLYSAYLKKRTPDAGQRFRRVSIGVAALIVPLVSELAVAPERLLIALGVSVFLRESFYLMKLGSRSRRLNGVVDFVPVALSVAFIFPYTSTLPYFLGFDKVVFILSGLIAAGYFFLKGEEEKTYHIYLNGMFLVISLVLLSWTVVLIV